MRGGPSPITYIYKFNNYITYATTCHMWEPSFPLRVCVLKHNCQATTITFLILLWLTPDHLNSQWETSHTGKC